MLQDDEIKKILAPYRTEIDSLDDKIVDLLVAREKIIREVASLKASHNIPPVLQYRVDEVRERCVTRALAAGMDGNYVRALYTNMIALSCAIEEESQNKND